MSVALARQKLAPFGASRSARTKVTDRPKWSSATPSAPPDSNGDRTGRASPMLLDSAPPALQPVTVPIHYARPLVLGDALVIGVTRAGINDAAN